MTRQPHPMREWSVYEEVAPPHLEGFFRSRRGEFRLTPLDNGRRTLLEGTTWYDHEIRPAWYWNWFSERIVHAIHHRVLEHVRRTTLADRAGVELSTRRGSPFAL